MLKTILKYLNTYLFCVVTLISCHRKLVIPQQYEDHFITVVGIDCQSQTTLDAESGSHNIVCDNVTLTYDNGHGTDPGPTSLFEYFKKSFRGFYYTSFFEKINMDSKLGTLFRDSVQIIDAVPASLFNGTPVFKCSACNAVAHVIFKKHDFYFPFTANHDYVENSTIYNFHFDVVDGFDRKIYVSKVGKKGGVFFKKNEKIASENNLLIQAEGNDMDEMIKIMYAIKMNKIN